MPASLRFRVAVLVPSNEASFQVKVKLTKPYLIVVLDSKKVAKIQEVGKTSKKTRLCTIDTVSDKPAGMKFLT